MKDYSATIFVKADPERAYQAISEEMSNWWTPMSGKFLQIGDKAKTDFGSQSYWEFEAVTLKQSNLVELRCCEANHIHEGLPGKIRQEWLDTMLRFEIAKHNKGSKIGFTHVGLLSKLICYDVCKSGWDHFFSHSLAQYLGKAQ